MKYRVEYAVCNDEAVNERNKKETENVIRKMLKHKMLRGEHIEFTYGDVEPTDWIGAMIKQENGFYRRYVEGEIK